MWKRRISVLLVACGVFFLVTAEVFPTTANPSNGKPCQPPCCEEVGKKKYYFCVSVSVAYKIECTALCEHPEGIGFEYYECQPARILQQNCCYELDKRYYVEDGCDNPNPLECYSDAEQVDCYFYCQDEIGYNRNCRINKSDPIIIKFKYYEQPKPFLIKEG